MASTMAPAALARLLGDGWRTAPNGAIALADALRALLVDGRLGARTRVPSERALAPALGVSRGTVSRAYDRLRVDGHLVSARGAGSWLTLPEEEPLASPDPSGRSPGGPRRSRAAQPAGAWRPSGSASDPFGDVPTRGLDLRVAALPAPEPLLTRAAAHAAARLSRHAASQGYAAAGLGELRDAVAARFAARGLPTMPDQVMVTAGAQHALHLVLALLVTPGDRVLVDAPAYPRTLSAVRGARARAVPVPLSRTGWDPEAWTHGLAAAAPRLALTVPDFHNPTGLTMAADARAALARGCARAGVVLVADETLTELRLDGPPVPAPLGAHDPGGTVVTIGSMSKAAWGGLRLGWIRAAPRLVRELAAIRADVDMASPVVEQLLGVELLGRWEEVVASRRALLLPRRDALLDALATEAPAWTVRRPRGGLSAWVRLPTPVATRLAAAAARERLQVAAGPSFSVDGTFEHHLRLPFTAPPEALAGAVATLARLAAGLGAGGGVEAPESSAALV